MATTNENLIPIPGRLHSVATEGHVAGADEIYDDALGKTQAQINQESQTLPDNLAYLGDDDGQAVIPGFDPQTDTLHKTAQVLTTAEKDQVAQNLNNRPATNGMARIELKATDNFKSVVEAQTNGNTIFVIKYDFTLTGNVTIPANCVLEFDGGSISGAYTITGANTDIQARLVKIFDVAVTLVGTWNVAEAYPEWFGAVPDGVTNCQPAFQKCVESFVYIRLQHGTYNFTTYNTTICTHGNWVDPEHIPAEGSTIEYKTCIFLFSDKTFTMVGTGREAGRNNSSRIGTILKWSGNTILDAFIRGGSENGNLSLQGFVVKGNGYDGYASDYSNGYGIQCAGYGKTGAAHHSLRDISVSDFNVGVRIAPNNCLMQNVTGSNGRIGIFVTGSLTQTSSYGPATSFSTIGAGSCDIGVYIKNQGYSSISNIAVGYCRVGVKIQYGQCVNFNGIGAEDCFRPIEIRNCVSATFNSLFARRNTPEYISEHYPTLTDDGVAVYADDFESVSINGLYIDKSGNRQGYIYLYPKTDAADSQSIAFYNFNNFVFDEVRNLRGKSYTKCIKVYLDNQNVLPSITPFVNDTDKEVFAYDSSSKKNVIYDRRFNSWDGTSSPRWIEEDGATLGVKRSGSASERPAGKDVYVGFMYIQTDNGVTKPIYVGSITGNTTEGKTAHWVDATGATV